MKKLSISPITSKEYDRLVMYGSTEVFHYHDGTISSTYATHPEYGDVILISAFHGSCLMIHRLDAT